MKLKHSSKNIQHSTKSKRDSFQNQDAKFRQVFILLGPRVRFALDLSVREQNPGGWTKLKHYAREISESIFAPFAPDWPSHWLEDVVFYAHNVTCRGIASCRGLTGSLVQTSSTKGVRAKTVCPHWQLYQGSISQSFQDLTTIPLVLS